MPRKKTWKTIVFLRNFSPRLFFLFSNAQVLIWSLAGPACRQYVHGSTAFLTSVKRAYCLLLDAHVCPDLKSSFGQRICGLWLVTHTSLDRGSSPHADKKQRLGYRHWPGRPQADTQIKNFYNWSVKKDISVHAAVPMKCCLYLVIFKVTQEVTQEEPLRYAVLRYFQKFCGSAVLFWTCVTTALPHYRNQ